MGEEIEKLLPIGSIIKLKEGKKRLMIFGIMQNDGENKENVFDYVGVIYPEGNMGLKTQFLFNHCDIEEIFFVGFSDIERQDFIHKLTKILKK